MQNQKEDNKKDLIKIEKINQVLPLIIKHKE